MAEDKKDGDRRARAEKVAAQKSASAAAALSGTEASHLIHELQVHQIELEMQNEELRRAQIELEASRIKYFDLYSLAPIGYCTIADGLITEANLTFARMLGVDRSTLVNRALTKLIHPEDQDAYYRLQQRLAKQEGPQVVELRLTREGGTFWARLEFVGALDAQGTRTLRAAISDINDVKHAYRALARADRAANIGLLASGVAHELNNPLIFVQHTVEDLERGLPLLAAAILPCVTELKAQVGEARFLELAGSGSSLLSTLGLETLTLRAQESLQGLQRIGELSRKLQALTRVEKAGTAGTDLNLAIHRAIQRLHEAKGAHAAIVLDLGPTAWARASESQLSQLFFNLLTRGLDALPKDVGPGNRVLVKTWQDERDVWAELTDTGPSPPAESLDRFFEPYFSDDGSGHLAGLGLAICKSIVAELGGEIGVDADPARGTRIRLRVPRASEPPRTPAKSRPVPGDAPIRGRILVVDDEAILRTTISRLLERQHEVVLAASGFEAQAILDKDSRFDAVICDLMMPGMSGIELHVWLSAWHPGLAERTMFVTGGLIDPSGGVAGYLDKLDNLRLEKPFDGDVLRKALSALVAASKAAAPGAPRSK